MSKCILLIIFLFWRITFIKELDINDKIPNGELVRLKGEDNEVLGIMKASEAKAIADEKNLDLVKITPNADPPVCKLMNYGKYKFDMIKKAKQAQKNQKVNELKEVWLSMFIDKHDVDTKANTARKFLVNGDKVKVTIRMRGRQQAFNKNGIEIMKNFHSSLSDVATIEHHPSVDGRNIIMILAPIVAK